MTSLFAQSVVARRRLPGLRRHPKRDCPQRQRADQYRTSTHQFTASFQPEPAIAAEECNTPIGVSRVELPSRITLFRTAKTLRKQEKECRKNVRPRRGVTCSALC